MSTPLPTPRQVIRRRLLAEREAFVAREGHGKADAELAAHLARALDQIGPERLGLYWSMRSEFNAAAACLANPGLREVPLALPFVRRDPRDMTYRAWNRQPPKQVDDCGIASADGPPVVPDVVLAPCLGFTDEGFRLGYGGGYFDRWLAAHPHVTAIGIAWSTARMEREELRPQAHDLPMMLVVTERGIVAG